LLHSTNVDRSGNIVKIKLTKTEISRLFNTTKEGSLNPTRFAIEEISYLLDEALELTFPDLFSAPRVFYLPAARSGILQAHRIIAANSVQMSPLFGINRIEIGQMSGTVADFLTNILAIDQEERGLLEISKSFEKKLIHGYVDLRGKDQYSLPEIIYEFRKHKIPLNRTSSTVSELAPLFLLLKHVIRKGDMVIIEEPEAHLHPANQKLLAELINAMVMNKVQLLITTHSDFLLGELSLLIKTPETSLTFIRAANTNVNLFKYEDSTKSTNVEKVPISDQEGIDEKEFGKIYEELYQEHLKIDFRREADEGGDLD
jgi:predicted ATPase